MQWHVRAELTGAPTAVQAEVAADAPGVVGAHFRNDGGPGWILVGVDAPDYAAALAKAKRALERLTGLHGLVAAGALSPPYRVTVESTDAPEDDLDVIATKALAGLLGVSEQRVRELAGKDRPGFPKVHRIEGASGLYFRRSEAEAYAPNHPSGPGGAH